MTEIEQNLKEVLLLSEHFQIVELKMTILNAEVLISHKN